MVIEYSKQDTLLLSTETMETITAEAIPVTNQ
jgi:hypothetical protein